jgi:uncharacterized protein involved in exopolysaccharide biosynthesis
MNKPENSHIFVNQIQDDEIDLFHLLFIIWKRRIIIITFFVLALVVSLLHFLMYPPQYRFNSKVTIFSLTGNNSMKGIIGQELNSRSVSASNEGLISILTSYSFRQQVVRNSQLLPALVLEVQSNNENSDKDTPITEDDVVKYLPEMLEFDSKKAELIIIEATSKSSELSVKLANAYVDTLEQYLKSNVFSIAKRNRIRIEKQLEQKKKMVEGLSRQLETFHKKNGIYDLKKQSETSINLYGKISQQLFEVNAKLENLTNISSSNSPSVIYLNKQKQTIIRQLSDLKDKPVKVSDMSDSNFVQASNSAFLIPLDRLPNLIETEKKIDTELKMQEELYNSLISRFEQAKVKEENEDFYIKVLDRALPSEPISIGRGLIKNSLIFIVGSLLLGFFLVFAIEFINKIKVSYRDSYNSLQN